MFWRERDRDTKEANVGPLCGHVRVLVVGDSDVGKTSLVNLIAKGSSFARPPQTVGCAVGVKHTTFGNPSSSSSSINGDSERDFFIELWDVSGHERYKECRSLFYSQINGAIFVHDLTRRRTKTSLQKWAVEIATTGTFTAPMGNGGPGGLPVPYIVIGNKADIAAKEGTRGSSGNLVDVARQWVEKQGLLPSSSSEELPLTESFPGSGGLIAAAKESRYDKEAVMKFFHLVSHLTHRTHFLDGLTSPISSSQFSFQLIRRRYFSDDLPGPSHWSISQPQRPTQRLDENMDDYGSFYNSTSVTNEPYKYNAIPPLPAQRNLIPPPTLYPQQPVSATEDYNVFRPAYTGSLEINSARSQRSGINV